jgi:hypothetical protein
MARHLIERSRAARYGPSGAEGVSLDFLIVEATVGDDEYSLLPRTLGEPSGGCGPEGDRRFIEIACVVKAGFVDERGVIAVPARSGTRQTKDGREGRISGPAQGGHIYICNDRCARRKLAHNVRSGSRARSSEPMVDRMHIDLSAGESEREEPESGDPGAICRRYGHTRRSLVLLPHECNVSADNWVSEAPGGPAGGMSGIRDRVATREGKRASKFNSFEDLRSESWM